MREFDRRAVFFLLAAVVCALLAPVTDGYAWVAGVLAAVYAVLALLSWLDHRSRGTRP
jgi:membrane associated rhomboid family serine protease